MYKSMSNLCEFIFHDLYSGKWMHTEEKCYMANELMITPVLSCILTFTNHLVVRKRYKTTLFKTQCYCVVSTRIRYAHSITGKGQQELGHQKLP